MSERDAVNGLLRELGRKLGTPELALSDEGTCALDYEQRLQIVVELPEGSELVYVYSRLMRIPKKGQKKLFRTLLRHNLLCYNTDGSTLAIDDAQEQVVLCYGHPWSELDQVAFENLLENFLTTANRLHADLTGQQFVDEDEVDADRHEPPPGSFIRA
jgi:hypothetical protein